MSKFKSFIDNQCPFVEALSEIGDFLHAPKLNDTIKNYARKLKEQGFTVDEVQKAVQRIINSFDRFPSYPELKRIVTSCKEPVKQEEEEIIPRCEKSHARFIFCQDCMAVMDLHCGEVCDYLTLHKIEVPENYLEIVKTTPKLDMVKLILGEGIYKIRKIKRTEFNNVLSKTSKKSDKKEVENEKA
tara:strand:+ start:2647 stop:3204 length:558 start_codon:yes stop_codon:yes gene_type:complete